VRAPEAIVVLGCRIEPGGAPSAAATRRTLAGLRAFRAGLAPILITSGGRRWPTGGSAGVTCAEATSMARVLVHGGVPEHLVYRELASLNTNENAIYTAALLDRMAASAADAASLCGPRGGAPRRVLIATCGWHLPRALDAFRRAGLDPSGIPADAANHSELERALLRLHEAASSRLDRARAFLRPFHGADHLRGKA
jgi:uncharacterized SAM-binding protein YcdF (DUF218 family)